LIKKKLNFFQLFNQVSYQKKQQPSNPAKMNSNELPWVFTHVSQQPKPELISTPCEDCAAGNSCSACYDSDSFVNHTSRHATFEEAVAYCFHMTKVRFTVEDLQHYKHGVQAAAYDYGGFAEDGSGVKISKTWTFVECAKPLV